MDSAPTGEYQYLGRKTLALFILNRSRIALILLLVSGGLFALFNVDIPIPQGTSFPITSANLHQAVRLGALISLAGFFVALGIALLIGWLVYINYRFMVGEDALRVKRGVLNKEEVAIPFRQIQDVTIERDLSYQMWGLSRIVILTAGHEEKSEVRDESEGILPAIDKALAEQLQETLLQKANVEKVTPVK